MDTHVTEEILEAIWTCRERGETSIEACLQAAHAEVNREMVQQMAADGLVEVSGDEVRFTDQGERTAAEVIRRHRLAERLFTDVLGLSVDKAEKAACSFEHSGVVPEITDGLCTLLGHPRDCPHGRSIPPGECCREGRTEVASALMPLAEVPFGRGGRVAYVRPQHHDRLHMLLSMGIAPGAGLRVHQRTPVLVVEVEQSEFAMDREVAEDVYVWVDPSA
jgi:DtxR family Mn-dependent transcriptional regulator